MPTRSEIAASTAVRLAELAHTRVPQLKAMVGLDGFVDEIIAVVDKRQGGGGWQPVETIAHFAKKVEAAIGKSGNYELVVKHRKLGGNGPIMANALASFGVGVTYVGNLGYPEIDPVFADFAKRAEVISIGPAAHTDALEFADGKLMLGKLEPLNNVNWDSLLNALGEQRLKELIGQSDLIGMVNWTMLPHMTSIWARLLDEVVPNEVQHKRKLFVDLADPEKRTSADIVEALRLLEKFQEQIDVVLGLNLKECVQVADVLGLPGLGDPEGNIVEFAQSIRQMLNLACVVVHPRRSAAAATPEETAFFEGPFVQNPKISTGAGDHFNAGFCLGRVLGLSLAESLCTGVSTSGYYVRTTESPTAVQLADFIAHLPDPQ